MSQKITKKYKKFVEFANQCEVLMSASHVAIMRSLAQLSLFSEKFEKDRTHVWQLFVKDSKCEDNTLAIKEMHKNLKALKANIKIIEDNLEKLE